MSNSNPSLINSLASHACLAVARIPASAEQGSSKGWVRTLKGQLHRYLPTNWFIFLYFKEILLKGTKRRFLNIWRRRKKRRRRRKKGICRYIEKILEFRSSKSAIKQCTIASLVTKLNKIFRNLKSKKYKYLSNTTMALSENRGVQMTRFWGVFYS